MNNFRVPKDALLDKLCSIDDDGTYHSEFKKGKRFALTMLSLSGGRIAVARAANVL